MSLVSSIIFLIETTPALPLMAFSMGLLFVFTVHYYTLGAPFYQYLTNRTYVKVLQFKIIFLHLFNKNRTTRLKGDPVFFNLHFCSQFPAAYTIRNNCLFGPAIQGAILVQ